MEHIIDTAAVLLSRDLALPDRGCVETIRSSAEASLAALGATPDAPRNGTAKGDFRILLVEDNPINQKIALTMLEKLGYQAALAQDGVEAVHSLARDRYDLVLMDCLMPEMDGFEATRLIRATAGHGAQVPIVAMTASAVPKNREACFEAGMTDYLSKPIRETELRDKLHRWLSGTGRPLEIPSVAVAH